MLLKNEYYRYYLEVTWLYTLLNNSANPSNFSWNRHTKILHFNTLFWLAFHLRWLDFNFHNPDQNVDMFSKLLSWIFTKYVTWNGINLMDGRRQNVWPEFDKIFCFEPTATEQFKFYRQLNMFLSILLDTLYLSSQRISKINWLKLSIWELWIVQCFPLFTFLVLFLKRRVFFIRVKCQ